MIKQYLSPGSITGILAAMTAVADLSGHWGLGKFFQDPSTQANINLIVTAAFALAAGFMRGIGTLENKGK